MITKTLPKRSTRGQPPLRLRQQLCPAAMRVKTHKNSKQQNPQIREMETQRKNMQLKNLPSYPFHRVVHYFHDLDSFPRLKAHPSYVENTHHLFNLTYPQEEKLIKGSPIGQLLNRKYFGLPYRSPTLPAIPKDNNCKNVCYGYLNNIQDKKHNIDRFIYSLKLVLKKMQNNKNEDLSKFEFIRKDQQLEKLIDKDVSINQKIAIIKEKLQILQDRKEGSLTSWQADDSVYFYHSLNQQLHNQINKLKKQFSNQNLLIRILLWETRQNIKKSLQMHFFDQNLKYYQNEQKYLSKACFLKFIQKNEPSHVIYPFSVAAFSSNKLISKLSSLLLGLRSASLSEAHFYEVKNILKKALKLDMQLRAEKIVSYDQYSKIFKAQLQKVYKIKENLARSKHCVQPVAPPLDNFVSCDSQGLGQKQFLNLAESVQLTNRQYALVMLYYWISKVVEHLLPYLTQLPQLIEIVGSDFYPKVHNCLVYAIGTPLSGILVNLLEAIPDILSKQDPFNTSSFRIFMQFNHKISVGAFYKHDTIEEINTSPARSSAGDREQASLGSKRVKRQ